MEWPHNRFSIWVDRQLNWIGESVSWLWLMLLGVIVLNVVMRYAFGEGRIEFEEIQWHLYAIGFLLGLSYANVSDSHVRVDVVRARLNPRHQAWIELYGILLLLLPFLALIIFYAIPFVQYSYLNAEVSEAPGGLPFRWLIKSFLIVGFSLLLLSSIARLSRVWGYLFGEDDGR